ncbi:hypothetical protein BGZ54_002620 [Gamsiella multidivaricata]|nr:hypothetical protein BGZ54_002620 [Gamsiella multidivaricata]
MSAAAIVVAAAFLTASVNGQPPSWIPPSWRPTSTHIQRPRPTADPTPTPGDAPPPRAFANFAFSEHQKLFISNGWFGWASNWKGIYNEFHSLDLSVPWTSDKPAWEKLAYRSTGEGETAGQFGISKDNMTLYFFDGKVHKYNVKTNTWDLNIDSVFTRPPKNISDDPALDLHKGKMYPHGDMRSFKAYFSTDPETGVMYGFGESIQVWDEVYRWRTSPYASIATFDPATNNYTRPYDNDAHRVKLSDIRSGVVNSLVLSAAAKKLYAFMWEMDDGESALFEYNILSMKWTQLNTTGDIPSPRAGLCFAPAYGGTKLILAGGRSSTAPDDDTNAALNDVYLYDVATSVWTKMASAPSPHHGGVCAVSGDSFIIWGGYSAYSNNNEVIVANEDGPAIFNMSSNTWGTTYTPTPVGARSPSFVSQ